MYLKENDIQTIRDYFVDKPVLKAYLFGSYSRNEADEDSDVDILVDLDYSRHKERLGHILDAIGEMEAYTANTDLNHFLANS